MSGPSSEPASRAPRIAIKFGAASNNAGKKSTSTLSRPSPVSTLGKRSRPHALGQDSDSEDDDGLGKHEAVTGFGQHGAERKQKARDTGPSTSTKTASGGPLVISGHKNRDWKAEARSRNPTSTPTSGQATTSLDATLQDKELPDHEKDIKWGLSVSKKEESPTTRDDPAPSDEKTLVTTAPIDKDPRDDDKDAIDALMGKRRKIGQDIVIASGTSEALGATPLNEDDSYRRALAAAADVSTVDEYDQIPDGEFGAAMLRGMGWKGEERAPVAKEVKRRTQYMGLGAKEDQEIKQAEVAKRHGHRERRPRLEDYRSSKDKERRDRDDRHRDSYKSERDRERHRYSHDGRGGERDRDRDRPRHDDRRSRR